MLDILKGLNREKFIPYVAVPEKGELSRRLKEMGIEYFVLPLGSYSSGIKNMLDIIRYGLRLVGLIIKCRKIAAENNIDLIYANAPRTFIFAAVAAYLLKIPIIWHLHIILGKAEAKLLRLFMGMKDLRVIAVSNAVKERLVGRDASLSGQVKVIKNGVDVEKYAAALGDQSFRQEIGEDLSVNLISYIGRVSRGKGIEDLVLAAEWVIKNFPNTRFLIIGGELFEKGRSHYRSELTSLIQSKGLHHNFIFLGPRQDIPRILSSTNILVLPSRIPEACPLVIFEGMISGKVVIASDHGGSSEIIKDGFNGILFKPYRHEDLAAKLVSILRSPDQREKLAQNARCTILESYTLKSFQENINRFICEIIMDYN